MAGLTTLPKAGTVLTVGIGELQVTADRHSILVSYGLGSCVAVCIWDPTRSVAGMAHVMLPVASSPAAPGPTPAKFADHALDALLAELGRLRVDRGRLVAKIAGGAQMFGTTGHADVLAVGKRNIERVKSLLQTNQIPLAAEHTGGRSGRTVSFFPTTGKLHIKTIGSGENEI